MHTSTILEIIKQFESEKKEQDEERGDGDLDELQEQISFPVLCSLITEETDIELLLGYLHKEHSDLTGHLLQYVCGKYPEVAKKFFEKEKLTPYQLGKYYTTIRKGMPKCLRPTFIEPVQTSIEKTILPSIEKFLKKYPKVLVANTSHPLFHIIEKEFPGHFYTDWRRKGVALEARNFEDVKKVILDNFKFDAVIIRRTNKILPSISLYLDFDTVMKGVNFKLSKKEYKQIKLRLKPQDNVAFYIDYKMDIDPQKFDFKASSVLTNEDKKLPLFTSVNLIGPRWNWHSFTRNVIKEKLDSYENTINNKILVNIPSPIWMNENIAPDIFILDFGIDEIIEERDIIYSMIKHAKK